MDDLPIRVGFVLHAMQVAGAEVLVAETIRRLGDRIEPVILCLDSVGALGQQLQAEGVPVIAYGRKAGLDLAVSWRMSRDLRSRGIQVLHAHQYTPFFYGAMAARLVSPRPHVIFTEHGRHYPDITSAKRQWANRWIFDRLADRVNAVCEFSARSLAEKDGFRAGRIEVIPNGIDAPRYSGNGDVSQLRRTLGLNPCRRYIACVARFHPVKDHRTLLRAFSTVAGKLPDVDLLLVGDGPLRKDLEQQVAEAGLQGRVMFLGVRSDVPEILRAIDVFTLSSVSEAASITLLEAMATSRPVVVTAVGGNVEQVRDGVDGLLVPRGDHDRLAESLIRVLSNPALAQDLGRSGVARVHEHYQLDATIARYGALYAEGAAESYRKRR